MKTGLRIGDFELFWLRGGRFALDGGAMFGVVPKALWSKKYPSDEYNEIPITAFPMLVKTPEALILLEAGLGNKLTEKQKKVFKVAEEWKILDDLKEMGIKREDIDYVILTHFDFDHAGGVIMYNDKGKTEITFPGARHIVQKAEWEDVLNPDMRSIDTYWPINNEMLRKSGLLELVEGEKEIIKGIKAIHKGGHTRGFQIIQLESKGETAIHLCDLLPTHAHFNPLWIMAYDNFPLESIKQKEKLEKEYIKEGAWFTFCHDPFLLACRFDDRGNITEKFIGEDTPLLK